MDRMEKLALKRLGWSVAGLGVLGVTRGVRRRYGVRSVGRVPLPVALGVLGVSALVRHQQEAADRDYWYQRGYDEAEAVADQEARYIVDLEAAAPSTDDQVKAAVERALRRQQSKAQHPSNGGE